MCLATVMETRYWLAVASVRVDRNSGKHISGMSGRVELSLIILVSQKSFEFNGKCYCFCV